MRDEISRTAEAMALVRAIESLRRGPDRLFYDPFAHAFLRSRWRLALALMRLPGMDRLALAIRERQFPGVVGALLCRTRSIDDALDDALRRGLRQVVILGAGFDSRAYRIERARQAAVFEVDRPAMLEAKRGRLQRLLGPLPGDVVFVGTDFDGDGWSEALPAAGFQPLVPTFFAWEGVTQYITMHAVDAVIDFIAGAARGSRVAFTYVHRAVVDGSRRRQVDQRVMAHVERVGEPWITGFEPTEIPAYLAERGLRVTDHVGANEYQARYLQPTGRLLSVYDGERLVVAEVEERT